MSIFIALVGDDHDVITLVRCADQAQADEVATEAVWGSGGISAYRVPTTAIDADADFIQALRSDEPLENAIDEAGSPNFPIRIAD